MELAKIPVTTRKSGIMGPYNRDAPGGAANTPRADMEGSAPMPPHDTPFPIEPRPCELCGALFTPEPIQLKRGKGKYCSLSCASRSRHELARNLPADVRRRMFEERFWPRVHRSDDPDGCWGWMAGKFASGYGAISGTLIGLKTADRAHRASWVLANGPIPDGLFVCHHCDNPPCVRPDHLFLGTVQDNSDDMVRKGRSNTTNIWVAREKLFRENLHLRGEQVASARLTEEKVREMRRLAAEGIPHTHLAKRFGVANNTAYCVVKRITWAHVADEEDA